ncbi:MAG: hypothetical protein MK538_12620 [Planctomycetes bacterium]|nr:hypothetical protein [Planctomycetota bacterium]
MTESVAVGGSGWLLSRDHRFVWIIVAYTSEGNHAFCVQSKALVRVEPNETSPRVATDD